MYYNNKLKMVINSGMVGKTAKFQERICTYGNPQSPY